MDGVGQAAGEIMSATPRRASLAVVGSVVCFALLLETAGLIPSVMVTVLVASRASPDTPVRDAVLCGVCLAVAVSVLFVVVLNQPLALFRMW